ncbi:MAG: epoxide hydrolase family protein [Nocardioidaceae bacterium]
MTSSNDITAFHLDIPESDLVDLRDRLARTRFPEPLPCDGWDTGVPVSYLRELVRYWREEYDWRAAEALINAWPQFTTEIDGTRIHFLHVRSANPDATPLVLTHGWPGSVVEFLDLIGPLTDPVAHGGDAADAFHLVIPSLPGFGFSGPVPDAGWDADRIAGAWVELMRRLGYDRFGVQGGDIGATVSPAVGRAAPDRVIGVHVNGSLGTPTASMSDDELSELSELERDRYQRTQTFQQQEMGYIAIQSTRPQTVGAALVDSPVGQLAWILDKAHAWTYPLDALPDEIIDRDRLLTNVMLYWLTGTAGSAAYVGYASAGWGGSNDSSGVPTATIMFAHDVGIRRLAATDNNIVRWTDVPDRGGHFAALEEPDTLVSDIRSFFESLSR